MWKRKNFCEREMLFKSRISSLPSWLCMTLAKSQEIIYLAAYYKLGICRTIEV